jgi:hypothetical protein
MFSPDVGPLPVVLVVGAVEDEGGADEVGRVTDPLEHAASKAAAARKPTMSAPGRQGDCGDTMRDMVAT